METIKENKLFKRLYTKGKKEVSKDLVVYFLPNKLGKNMIGFTVSKKVGKAVVRNRIRRLMRESLRKYEPLLKQGYFFVFVARTAAAYSSYSQIDASLSEMLKKADLFE